MGITQSSYYFHTYFELFFAKTQNNLLLANIKFEYCKTSLSRLNQDHVEQLFSVIRSMGGQYTQFGALEFIRRIRNFCLTAGGNHSIEAANVQPTENSNFNIENYITEDLQVHVRPENCLILDINAVVQPQSNIIDQILDDYTDVVLEGPESQTIENSEIDLNLPEQMEIENIANDLTDTFNLNDWIGDNITLEGVSREKLVEDCKFMEREFREYHSFADNGQLKHKKVTRPLIQKLEKTKRLKEYDRKLIKRFVVTRTMKRMKFIQISTIQHIKSARAKKKVIDFVHTQAASKVTASKLKSKEAKKKPVKRLRK